MLNCCIERKKKRERRQLESAAHHKSGSSESDEDIFYECPDDIDTASAHSAKDGRLMSG